MSTVPWQRQAKCLDSDPDLFFSPDLADQLDARLVCRDCPVRVECLQYALDHNSAADDHGIWGGTRPSQRRALRANPTAARRPATVMPAVATSAGQSEGSSRRQTPPAQMVAWSRQPDGVYVDASGRVTIVEVDSAPRWVVLVDDEVVDRCRSLVKARKAAWTALNGGRASVAA